MEEQEIVLSNKKHKVLKKRILIKGDFSTNPLEGAVCEIEITDVDIKNDNIGYHGCEDSVILSEDFDGQWTIGKASAYIDLDIERCLRHMFLDETSMLHITYLDKHDAAALEISCKVAIKSIRDEELFCDWHWAKKFLHAKAHKDDGVKLTKDKRLIEAFRKFSKALKFMLTLDKNELEGVDETDMNEIQTLKVDLYNNLAFCQLQFNEYQAVVVLCDKALEIKSNSEKALYRRGCARMGTADWETAYEDICQVLALDPSNAAAKCKAAELREKVIHMNEAYKKVIKNMFV